MSFVLLTLFVLWSFFPAAGDFYIGFIPAVVFLMVVLALRSVAVFRNALAIPGLGVFALYATTVVVASLLSPLSASSENLLKGFSTAVQWAILPLVAIWFREAHFRYYFSNLVIVGSLALSLYAYVHRLEVSTAEIGPMDFTVNSIATVLTLSSSIMLAIVGHNKRPKWQRRIAFVTVVVCFLVSALVLSSRTAIIAQLATVGLYLLVAITFQGGLAIRLTLNRRTAVIVASTLAISYAAGFGLYQSSLLPDFVSTRLAPLFPGTDYITGNEALIKREMLRAKAMKILEEYPFLGVGTGNFNFYPYDPSVIVPRIDATGYKAISAGTHNPHSTYFKVLAENGLIGFMLFSLSLGWLFRTAFRITLNPAAHSAFDFSAVAWIPSYLILSLTHDVGGLYTNILLIMLYGMVLDHIWNPELNWRFASSFSHQLKRTPLTDPYGKSPNSRKA